MSTASRSPASPAASPASSLLDEPSVFTIINTNSPLKLDVPMMEGIIQMSGMGQVVIVTPFTLAGAMAPVTVAGALVQQNAEALAGISFTQMVKKGAPVGYGGFTSNVDMKSGAPAFGTPEYMKAQMVGGQLARRYGIPYRTSNVCAANTVDAQAAYESVFSLWGAIQGGGNFMLHSAGWLEGGLRCSYEKTILDIDLLQMVAEFLTPLDLSEDALAVDAMRDVGPGGHFFGTPTRSRATRPPFMRRSFPTGATTRPGRRPARPRRSSAPTASGKSGWRPMRSRRSIPRSKRKSTPSSRSARPKAARRRISEPLESDSRTTLNQIISQRGITQ